MPYANIHWIKLQIDILHDKRFIFDCNNDQKWLFIGLLLLAGATGNEIPNDENYLKNRLNLPENSQKIRENIDHLCKVFSGIVTKNGTLKFKNFKKIHNRIGNSDGLPKDDQRGVQIRKEQIDKIIEEYITLKHIKITNEDGSRNKELVGILWPRNVKPAKNLLLLTQGGSEKILSCMRWFSGICESKGLTWTLETIIRWLPEYVARGEAISQEALRKEFNLK